MNVNTRRTPRMLLVAGLVLSAGALMGGVVVRAGAKPGASDTEAWRTRGPQGLDDFWAQHREAIEKHRARMQANDLTDDPQWNHLSTQLDAIAGQRNAWASHLYWYTDLDAARAASQEQHKPILSLRMLGKLTDEYSCANSRFFRTALYANTDISSLLREKFILHWKSERPVPVMTVDMGDGRVLKRTLTGNSVHYLLDSQGRPLDALPGLYGPGAFSAWLERSVALFQSCDGHDDASRTETLRQYHRDQLRTIADEYAADVQSNANARSKYAQSLLQGFETQNPLLTPSPKTVNAPIAENLTATKVVVEAPLLNATRLYALPSDASAASWSEAYYWDAGLPRFLSVSRLDANSRLLMRSQRPPTSDMLPANSPQNTAVSLSRGVQFLGMPRFAAASSAPPANLSPYERLVDGFERSMAQDTARNELRLHAPLHEWFLTNDASDLETLNRIVYDRLLLMPRSDPWLGLSPQGTYTGLDNGGLFNGDGSPAPATIPSAQLQRQVQLSR